MAALAIQTMLIALTVAACGAGHIGQLKLEQWDQRGHAND